MIIYINEVELEIKDESNLFQVRDKYKKDADILIVNGYPVKEDIKLKHKDRITLIKRGEIPKYEELEALMISRHTPNIHNKLKSGTVAILGLGGLGSNIAISLARIGVGNLLIADFDIVEPSNLNRQQYFINDIGKYKTEALKDIILNINPFIKVNIVNQIVNSSNMHQFTEADIIIEAFDNPGYKAEIANVILTKMRDKYLISSSGMAGYYDSNIIKTRKVRNKFYICGDEIYEAKEGEGLMAPRVSICANHMANLATRILIGDEN